MCDNETQERFSQGYYADNTAADRLEWKAAVLGYASGMNTRKNAAAVALGRRGGRARAKALTAAERRAIATKAIRARWSRVKKGGAR